MQKILIIDDEPMMLKVATKILSKKYQIVCAMSGADALEIFDDEKPDLILSDLIMPKMDGYEFYQKLQEKISEPIPIIFMTADESDDSESQSFEVGAADYVRKPFKPDILLRRVTNILENAEKIHKLKKAADFDAMTGLLNKSATQKILEKICEKNFGTLMMIDLDSFKLVNDIYGHGAGDKILIKFADLIKNSIRATDTAGRMGGDEFIAFCENIHDEKIIAEKTKFLNEKILEAAKNFIGKNFEIPLGVSIGAVFVPDEGTDFKILYEKADNALYTVKRRGKHDFAIYSDEDSDKNFLQNKLSDARKIFGERNDAPGAFYLEPENFKNIYRFAVRLVSNYKTEIQFLKITAKNLNKNVFNELKNLLKKILRRSDCITDNDKNEIYILLPKTPPSEIKTVEKRILEKIKQSDVLSDCEIDFYSESI